MEELQARIRAIQALQTELNAVRKPQSELISADDREAIAPGNVVEMPAREAIAAPPGEPTTKGATKRKAATKRKSQPANPKPKSTAAKAMPARRQWRDMQAPYMDELKRLEAQAEKLNYLLAERARKQAELASSSAEVDRMAADAATIALPPNLRKPNTNGLRQDPLDVRGEGVRMSARGNDEPDNLDAQAEQVTQRIDQLLLELETTLRQAGMIIHKTQHQQSSRSSPKRAANHRSATVSNGSPALEDDPSFSRASYSPLETDNHTMKYAVREAGETAQALRSLAGAGKEPRSTVPEPNYREPPRQASSRAKSPIRRLGLRLQQFFQVPQKPIDRIGDALLWIVVAAVVRVGVRLLLAAYPALTPIGFLLMLAPAALAVYLACFVPKAGFVSIYRPFLVMLGLLLGNRL